MGKHHHHRHDHHCQKRFAHCVLQHVLPSPLCTATHVCVLRPCLSRFFLGVAWRQVDWRFLAVEDDEPGFLTAWLQPRSLERQVDRREEECQNGVLAEFSKEIGVNGVFATTNTRVSRVGIAHDRVRQGEIDQNRVGQGGNVHNRISQGGIDHNHVSKGGIKTLENANDNNVKEREDIERTGRDSMASLDESDGQSSEHAHPEPTQVGASCIRTSEQ